MEAILPTRKMVVEADKASSVDGGRIKDVEDQVEAGEEEVGRLAAKVVDRVKVKSQTSRHNINNKMPTSTSMMSKFLKRNYEKRSKVICISMFCVPKIIIKRMPLCVSKSQLPLPVPTIKTVCQYVALIEYGSEGFK